MIENIQKDIKANLRKYHQELVDMKPQEMLSWGYKKFGNKFAITTSFGIQSSVLLNMVSKLCLQKKIKVFWIDTGYLCLLYTSPSPRDRQKSRMPSSA